MILDDGKLKVALYRAKAGNAFDGLVNAFTAFGGFSHCELVFPDGNSFSSTTRDPSSFAGTPKKDGTRWKLIDFDPTHWAFGELAASAEAIEAMCCYADSILDARYDYWGALRFAIPFLRQHPTEYFCSEAVIEVAQAGDLFNKMEAWRVSPNRMANVLGVK